MPPELTDRRWTLRHYQPTHTPEPDAYATAKAALRDMIRADGFVLAPETFEQVGDAHPITLTDDDAGYAPWNGEGEPDGFIREYAAGATEKFRDPDAVGITRTEEDGSVIADVPHAFTVQGGGLPVRHQLGGPVTVTAFDVDGKPIGYLFAQDVTDDLVHVELMPGAVRLRIVADEVEDVEDDDEDTGA